MFNPVTATFVVAIGVFAGAMFDGEKKYHEMVWVGIFLVVFTPIIIGGRYGFNWGFAGLIEIIAGLGLYKMFFHQMFESSYALRQQRERYYQKESTNPINRESVDRLEDKLEKPENERKEWISLLKKNNPEKQKNELIDKLSPQEKSMLFFLILVAIIFIIMTLSFPNY
jgi:hypothetical protein